MLSLSKYSKILKIAVCLFIATTAIFLLSNFALAAAGPDVGLNYAAGTGLSNTQDIRVTIAKIIRVIIGFLGIIAVGLVMYAGWLWMTSEGNEEKIEQAKKILQNAVIGLIIILSAFAIVSFILNVLGGGSGGPGGGQKITPPKTYGLSALGNGIIESHYPAPNQKEVPRNTSIIITFREPILASTACATSTEAVRCEGEAINADVVRIFKKDEAEKCADKYSSSSGCSSLVGAKVYSDGKNYVFVPTSYLGSPSEYIDYMVYLSSGLKRKSGEDAFPGYEKEYHWIFEVSNKIDLTPPQIIKNEMVPAPDNVRDTVTPGAGDPAIGTITVLKRPSIYQEAIMQSIATATPATVLAGVVINKSCEQDGNFSITIAPGPIASLYKVTAQGNINLGQGVFGSSSSGNKQVVFSECDLALTLSTATDNFREGYRWNLKLNKTTVADGITVGGITYTASDVASGNNFVAGSTVATAASIATVINSNNLDVIASPSDNVVTVTTKIAGLIGNSINLSSSSSTVLAITPMKNGTDKKDEVNNNCIKNPPQPNCKTDEPMNSAIEIVFNEAIMPLVVSGSADDLKNYIRVVNADATAKPTIANPTDLACTDDADCKSFICGRACIGDAVVNTDAGAKSKFEACSANEQCKSNNCSAETDKRCIGDNNYLKGKFEVSNQYRTVDFLSDKECGFNACGEKIYCLPANSNLRVELKAASLIPCDGDGNDSKCQAYSPFNICDTTRKFCRDSDNKYFPQAAKDKPNIVDGIIDAAFNSLDGNRNDLAYGPASYYNENVPVATEGDNYRWSFFISGLMDLIPPKILTTTPKANPAATDPAASETLPVTISFSKLMLSSRLTTGSLMISNGKENIQHYLLNLRSFTDQPLGYWATNEGVQSVPGESAIDRTDVYINHTPFSKASTYKAQAGSGLKDIYQNCFLPCDGPACTGVTSEDPCCCNGAVGKSCP